MEPENGGGQEEDTHDLKFGNPTREYFAFALINLNALFLITWHLTNRISKCYSYFKQFQCLDSEADALGKDFKESLFEPENEGPLPPPTDLAKKHAKQFERSRSKKDKGNDRGVTNNLEAKTIEKKDSSLIEEIRQMRKTQTEISHPKNPEDLKHKKSESVAKEPIPVETEVAVEVQVNVVSQPLNIVTDNLPEPSSENKIDLEKVTKTYKNAIIFWAEFKFSNSF